MMINKKQTWSDNPFDQWTEEELLCMKNQDICYGKGGGGSPPPPPAVQTQVQQSEFPSELKPFISDIFGKAQAIQEQREEEGFQAFEGPLQAQFDPAQTRAFERIEQIPGATQPLFEEATTLAREATRSPTDPQEVASFMNPFLRNVTDIQKREAERVADVEEQNLAAQAAQAGAFGGSRAAVLEAERQRNLAQQLDDIEARGLAASYQDAQARLANQRAREAAGATQLASLGSAIPAQQLKELGALSGVGAARQTQAQRGIDLARQEFEAEEAFPLRTLQEFSSILRGFPIEPTRTTTKEQFSAAQPLSTQLLGVGTQALGALGAAGIKPFGQAGGMVREMPVKAQSGGALSSLMQKTEDLDTSPVIGMKKGGSFIDQILTGGLLATDKAVDIFKKLPAPMMKMLGGAALPQVLSKLGSRAEAPPPPTIPQEELDRQIDAALRQRAAQGQQMASRGAGPAQVGAQIGQVRQPFKGGGGLRQMVQLPSNRVRFGKTAYQDASYVGEALEDLYTGALEPFDIGNARARAEFMRKEADTFNKRYGSMFNPDIYLDYFRPGEASAFLKEADQRKADFEASIGEAPAALTSDKSKELDIPPASKTPSQVDDPAPAPAPDKKKEGTKLYRSPEEAAYASLIDSDAGQKAAKRYFAGENVALANISEALKAYKGFKDTEMAQRRLINEAKIKEAATKRASRKAALQEADLLADIANKRDESARTRLTAATKALELIKTTLDRDDLRRAYESAPDSPKGQEYARALRERDSLVKTVNNLSIETPQSQFVGGLATGQVPLGLNPALQQSIAGLLKKATS